MCIYNMEKIQLDTLVKYTDYCEVVDSDEESSDEADWIAPTTTRRFVSLDVDIPITEEQMNELRNATSSTGMSDDYCDSEEETSFTPEVMGWYLRVLQSDYSPTRVIEVPIPREMPYYLPLKTLDQYDEIQARRQSNGKGYNRTFIG